MTSEPVFDLGSLLKNVLIFGGTGGSGRALLEQLKPAGSHVTLLCRPGRRVNADLSWVNVVEGDANDARAVARAWEGVDAGGLVISALGAKRPEDGQVDDRGNILVIEEALKRRPGRFLLITSLGCGEMMPFASERALAAFGTILAAKTRAEDHLRSTDLPYTILRPGGLRDGAGPGRAVLTEDPEVHGWIHREQLAALALRIAGDPGSLRRALAALDASLARCEHPLREYTPGAPAVAEQSKEDERCDPG